MSEQIRVLLVDDQPLIRAGFSMVIDSQPDMEVIGQACDGIEALAFARAHRCDIVLMDVRMPRMDGIEAAAALTAEGSDGPRIIMLTTFDLDEYVMRAIRCGASGFLLKDAKPEDLLSAIRTVHSGDAVIAPSATRRLMEHMAASGPLAEVDTKRLETLTEREREVLTLIAKGRSNQEIADELFVAEATVKTHVGRILAKLDARDRVQAVIAAYDCGLVRAGK
ncbi:response regulator [Dermabacteraceae bacterium P13115]|nr:response regulator transcription factor [Dermabacteraceae bacterium TAE3-ERU5]